MDLTNFEHGFDQKKMGNLNLQYESRKITLNGRHFDGGCFFCGITGGFMVGSAKIFHRFGLIGVWLARFSVFGQGDRGRSVDVTSWGHHGSSMWGCDHWDPRNLDYLYKFDLWVFEMNQIYMT